MRSIFAWMVLGSFLLAGCTSQPSQLKTLSPDTRLADLAGSWEIDYRLTEDPQAKMYYLYDIVRSQVEQQQRAAERDPRGPRATEALRDLQGVIKLGVLADELARSTVLTIEQSDGFISIKRSDDYALTCDFLAPVVDLKVGQESCGFDSAGRLVFEARLPEGLTVINRYSLSAGDQSDDDKRLYASLILRSNKFARPFVLNRVYMQFPPGEGMYKCRYTLEKKETCWLGGGEVD